MKTEHTLIPWTTDKGYGEECTKCGFRFTKKMEGETIIITPAFYETEDYKKCPGDDLLGHVMKMIEESTNHIKKTTEEVRRKYPHLF